MRSDEIILWVEKYGQGLLRSSERCVVVKCINALYRKLTLSDLNELMETQLSRRAECTRSI